MEKGSVNSSGRYANFARSWPLVNLSTNNLVFKANYLNIQPSSWTIYFCAERFNIYPN